MRWLAMTREMGFTPEDFNVRFVPGVYKLSEIKGRVRQEIGEEEVALVVIDTSAAYFPGNDENNNVELGNHARSLRKDFVELPGGPCVVICCHPNKYADEDNLQPRGGGAYVAELDGNLTCVKQGDDVAELHWQTKFRGPNFAPMTFGFKTVKDHPLLKDSDGDALPTVIATALSEQDKQHLTNNARRNQDVVLMAVHRYVGAHSLADLARAIGWLGKDGDTPEKMKVHRAIDALTKQRMVKKHRDSWKLTTAGETEVKRLMENEGSTTEELKTTDDAFDEE